MKKLFGIITILAGMLAIEAKSQKFNAKKKSNFWGSTASYALGGACAAGVAGFTTLKYLSNNNDDQTPKPLQGQATLKNHQKRLLDGSVVSCLNASMAEFDRNMKPTGRYSCILRWDTPCTTLKYKLDRANYLLTHSQQELYFQDGKNNYTSYGESYKYILQKFTTGPKCQFQQQNGSVGIQRMMYVSHNNTWRACAEFITQAGVYEYGFINLDQNSLPIDRGTTISQQDLNIQDCSVCVQIQKINRSTGQPTDDKLFLEISTGQIFEVKNSQWTPLMEDSTKVMLFNLIPTSLLS